MEKKEFFFILGLISTTFFLHLYDFGLPPLNGDELVYFSTSLTMITSPDSELYKFSETWGLRIGKFPIQFSPYLGGVSSYLSIPTLFFLGINPESARIYQMIIAASIVVLTYFTGKELFSKRVGVISSSLLVVFPVFVFFFKTRYYV